MERKIELKAVAQKASVNKNLLVKVGTSRIDSADYPFALSFFKKIEQDKGASVTTIKEQLGNLKTSTQRIRSKKF